MFVLTDFDPYGVHIFGCYAVGSKSLEFESGAPALRIHFLGIKSEQILQLACPGNQKTGNQKSSGKNSAPSSIDDTSGIYFGDPISQMSLKDRLAARSILKKFDHEEVGENVLGDIQRELQIMMMLGLKAEIQWLDDAGNICNWLEVTLNLALEAN